MGKSQKDKGARFERLIAKDIGARRGQVFNGEDDVVTSPDSPYDRYHIECKHQETTKIHDWMRQSIEAAKGKMPIVVHKRNRDDILVTMLWEDFKKLNEGGK